jgi:hypothetical protein
MMFFWPNISLIIFIGTLFFSTCLYAQDWSVVGKRGMMTFVVIKKEREKDLAIYREVISSECLEGEFCKILFWSNSTNVPRSWPMTEDERKSKVADYFFNGNSGESKFYFIYSGNQSIN